MPASHDPYVVNPSIDYAEICVIYGLLLGGGSNSCITTIRFSIGG